MTRLPQITYVFPTKEQGAVSFFQGLKELFIETPQAQSDAETIKLVSASLSGAFPVTVIQLANVESVQVLFPGAPPFCLLLDSFALSSQLLPTFSKHSSNSRLSGLSCVSLQEVITHLQGHLVRIDHTGVILPTARLGRSDWEKLVSSLASVTTMYRYPGEEWPFILPSSAEEFSNDIVHFSSGREPKFELVYAPHAPYPFIQIDVETNLTRQQVEQLFPDPYGVSLPGLEAFFRSIYLEHPWSGFAFRIDCRFKSDQASSDWDTGRWIVTEGGRLH